MLKMKTIPLMISLILLLLCLPSFLSADDYTLSKSLCFNNQTYNNGSVFATNVDELFASLSTTIVPPTGFGEGSVGQDENQVYGLGQCRGYVSATNCSTCLNTAISKIRSSCPNKKGAIFWSDLCQLKYSDVNFFGQIDDTNTYSVCNLTRVSNPATFNTQVTEFLSLLSKYFATENPNFFASGHINFNTTTTLYGFVQCTKDLTPGNCTSCLDLVISQLTADCRGALGARIGSGSCSLRYELYSIFDALAKHSMDFNINNGISYVTTK